MNQALATRRRHGRTKFASNLKARMEELGVTAHYLAMGSHLPPRAIYFWLNGEREPTLADLGELAYVLDTTVDALIGWNPEEQS